MNWRADHPPENIEVAAIKFLLGDCVKAYFQEGKWFDCWHRPIKVILWKYFTRNPITYDHSKASFTIQKIIEKVEMNQI